MSTVVVPVAERRELGEVSDSELVHAARSGDDLAFERLYQRYHRRIAAYVLGMVNDHGRAEDITQEVFISALRRMRQTERSIAFKPWIYEIAKNACIDQFRRGRRAEEISFDTDEGQGTLADGVRFGSDGGADEVVTARQDLDHLRGAFGGLSQAHHRILVLRELEGRSYREIGERMGLSRPSVESTLFRARRRLGEEYQELSSGERCASVQSMILTPGAALGARDRRRLDAHIAHCRPCRREARLAALGLRTAGDRQGGPLAAKVAGVLPFPIVWRRGGDAGPGATASGGVLPLPGSLSGMAEPLAGWVKALVAATVVAAGAGAGAASVGGVEERAGGPATAARTAKAPAPESSASRQRPTRAAGLDRTFEDAGRASAGTVPAGDPPAARAPSGGGAGGPAREEVARLPAAAEDPALPPSVLSAPAPVAPLEAVEKRPQAPALDHAVEGDVAAPQSVPGADAEAGRVAGPLGGVDPAAAVSDQVAGAVPAGG